MVKELLDMHSVRLYGVAARLASFASLMLVGFQGALVPLITTFHHEPRAPSDLARAFRYFLACAMPATLLITLYSREVMVFLAEDLYVEGHVLIPWLAAGTLLSGMYVFMPGLWLARKTYLTLAINVASAVVAVALAAVLVPTVGMVGAALATLAGGACNFLAMFVMSQRQYRLLVEWTRILAGLGLFAVLVTVDSLSALADNLGHWLRAGYAALAALFIALTLVPPAEARRLAASAWRELSPR
jgi:O-antigen/teichoic acid export membrane protein